MKAEQRVVRLSAIFLLVFLGTGTKSFGQSLKDQEQTIRQSQIKDSIAFDNYFARRASAAAIKDSVDTQSSALGGQEARSASANSSRKGDVRVLKSNTIELNTIQPPNNGRSLSSGFNYNLSKSEQRRNFFKR